MMIMIITMIKKRGENRSGDITSQDGTEVLGFLLVFTKSARARTHTHTHTHTFWFVLSSQFVTDKRMLFVVQARHDKVESRQINWQTKREAIRIMWRTWSKKNLMTCIEYRRVGGGKRKHSHRKPKVKHDREWSPHEWVSRLCVRPQSSPEYKSQMKEKT